MVGPLVNIAKGLSGDDCDPVIHLQTVFGGGKTHSMFAHYHLFGDENVLPVVCWSGICRLGSIEIGSLGPIDTLSFDHKSGSSPESQSGLLADINKPLLQRSS